MQVIRDGRRGKIALLEGARSVVQREVRNGDDFKGYTHEKCCSASLREMALTCIAALSKSAAASPVSMI